MGIRIQTSRKTINHAESESTDWMVTSPKTLRKHGKMQHPRKCSILGVGQSNQRQNGDGIKLKKEEEEEEEGELEGRRGRG